MAKSEHLQNLLREAAAEYWKDQEKGWVHIGFLAKRKDTEEFELWYQEARQVAYVTETEVIFAEGNTFHLKFVEDVILLN